MNTPFRNTQPVSRNSWWLAFIHFLLFIFLIDCKRSTDPDVIEPSTQVGQLTVSEFKAGVSQEIGALGGTVQISDPTSPLNGFKIEIPAGAYAESRTFKVSYAAITKHELPKGLEPGSSLIEIENSAGDIIHPINLTIPINRKAGQTVGIYSLNELGEWKMLPTLSLTDSQITAMLLSLAPLKSANARVNSAVYKLKFLVINSLEKELENYAVDTDFTPALDGWEFPNEGTYAAVNGICSGISMTALWYFKTNRSATNTTWLTTSPIFASKTPNASAPLRLEADNTLGIKFASVVALKQNFSIDNLFTNALDAAYKTLGATAKLKWDYNEFLAAGQMFKWNTKPTPLLLLLMSQYRKDRHALLVIGKTSTELTLYDPNYPKQIKHLKYDPDKGFDTYRSGNIDYTNFMVVEPDLFVPYTFIKDKWDQLKNGTIGNEYFPKYIYKLLNGTGKDIDLQQGTKITSPFKVFIDNSIQPVGKVFGLNGKVISDNFGLINLKPGSHTIGVLVEDYKSGGKDWMGNLNENVFRWADFQWFDINVDQSISAYFSFKVNGNATDMKYQGYGLRYNTYQIINGYQYNGDDQDYKVGAMFLELQINKSLFKGVGSYNLNGTDGQAFLYTIKYIDSKTRGHSDYIHSSKNNSGTLTVTSLTSDFIEGTFNFTAPEAYFGTGNGQTMAITDGKFRVKIK